MNEHPNLLPSVSSLPLAELVPQPQPQMYSIPDAPALGDVRPATIDEPANAAQVSHVPGSPTPTDAGQVEGPGRQLRDVPLSAILIDEDIRPRSAPTPQAVDECVAAIKERVNVGRLTVMSVDDAKYLLVDGHLRYEAMKNAGVSVVQVEVFQGDRRDAILFAICVNAKSRTLTPADKRRAVERLLRDPESLKCSARQLALRSGISDKTITKIGRGMGLRNSAVGSWVKKQDGSEYQLPPPKPKAVTLEAVRRKVEATGRYVAALVKMPWDKLDLDTDSVRELNGLRERLVKLIETIHACKERAAEQKRVRGRSTAGIPQAAKKARPGLKGPT